MPACLPEQLCSKATALTGWNRALEHGRIDIRTPKNIERLPDLLDPALMRTTNDRQVAIAQAVTAQACPVVVTANA